MLNDGDIAPDVVLDTSEGRSVRLSSLAGQKIVLYFYPRDDTPGCTQEAKDFTNLIAEFAAVGARVIRAVTHLDVSVDDARRAASVVAKAL